MHVKRILTAALAAALLVGVLAGPVTAAKPALNVTVSKAPGTCHFTVNVTWDKPKRGQSELTIFLWGTRTSYRPYAILSVTPTQTSGSAEFDATPNTDQFSDNIMGVAFLNRGLDGSQHAGDLLLEGRSNPLVTPDCLLVEPI